jgi:hypothetical protein
MTVESTGRTVIGAPVEACWAGTIDFEHWTDWARDISSVKVLDPGGDGRPRRVEFGVELVGKDYGATLDFDLSGGPGQVSFGLVESRKLRTADGVFDFAALDDGSTALNFSIKAELVKPKAARIERLFARRIETMLSRDLKRHVERGARRR